MSRREVRKSLRESALGIANVARELADNIPSGVPEETLLMFGIRLVKVESDLRSVAAALGVTPEMLESEESEE